MFLSGRCHDRGFWPLAAGQGFMRGVFPLSGVASLI